jgi:hypothetical protein
MEATVARTNNLVVAGLCLLGAVLVVAVGFLPANENVLTIGLVAVLGIVCASPAISGAVRGSFDSYGLLNLVCVVSFVQLGVGTLYLLYDPKVAYDPGILPWVPKALMVSIAGMIALLGGWVAASKFCLAPLPVVQLRSRGTLWVMVALLIGMFGQYATVKVDRQSNLTGQVNPLLSLFIQCSVLSLVVYFWLFMRLFTREASRAERWLLFAAVIPCHAVCLLYFLGNKSFCMTLFALPVLAYRYARGKFPSVVMTALVLITIFIVFPFFNAYRSTNTDYSIGSRVTETVGHLSSRSGESYRESSVTQVGGRLALINSVAIVIRETGKSVDYQYGRTLSDALLGFTIPRVLWPEKPFVSLGREFSRQFRIQPRWDDKTWVAPTIIGELYWNLGLTGVIAGMFALGAILRAIYRGFGESGLRNPLNTALYAGLLTPLLSVESSVGAYIGIIIKMMLILAALQWILRANGILARRPEGGVPLTASPA